MVMRLGLAARWVIHVLLVRRHLRSSRYVGWAGQRPGRGSVLPVLAGAPFIGFIPVRDTSGARSFYEGILGLCVVEETSFALVVDASGTMLRLTGVPELAPQPFTIAGWQVPDVTAAVRQLNENGVRCIRYDGIEQDELAIWTTPGGDRVAWFQDPDGNTLSLTTFASERGGATAGGP
jgi:catechol 2,3-dioxygenase-like lactoylglutathione lyase family enzyme